MTWQDPTIDERADAIAILDAMASNPDLAGRVPRAVAELVAFDLPEPSADPGPYELVAGDERVIERRCEAEFLAVAVLDTLDDIACEAGVEVEAPEAEAAAMLRDGWSPCDAWDWWVDDPKPPGSMVVHDLLDLSDVADEVAHAIAEDAPTAELEQLVADQAADAAGEVTPAAPVEDDEEVDPADDRPDLVDLLEHPLFPDDPSEG